MTKILRRPTGKVFKDCVCPAIAGYDLVADYYDEWYWQSFWEANERPLISEELKRFQSNPSPALDAGTGTGMYLKEYVRLGIRGVGLDASLSMLNQARKQIDDSVPLICGRVEQLPFAKEAFNVVIACRVLTHVRDLDAAMSELGRVTRASGWLIVSDVSALHNYTTARIPTPDGDVHIETYKFATEQLIAAAKRTGYWQVDHVESISYRNLIWQPESGKFPSVDIYSGKPIFFYGILRRFSGRS
jgi:ubiquinone/menaquinone biosynthesis C-methylase UbiE